MDEQPGQPSGGRPPRRELQGPRPTPLKVSKDSRKIRKPPTAPPDPPPQQPPPPRKPVIIYAVSPKVIHTNPSEFMNLVQRLTGRQDSAAATSHPPPSDSTASTSFIGGPVMLSPAARFASIERTKMPLYGNMGSSLSSYMDHIHTNTTGSDQNDDRVRGGFSHGHSILSPGPSGLIRPVPATLFSPLSNLSPLASLYHQQHQDQYFSTMINEQLHQQGGDGGGGGSNVLPSPSAASFLSPNPTLSPSTIEFLSRLLDQ